MSPKLVLALALGAGVLLALVWLETPQQAPVALDRRIYPGLLSHQIVALEVAGRGRPRLLLRRVADGFTLAGDRSTLSTAAVQRLFAVLEFLQATRRLPATMDPKRLGLVPARLVLTIATRAGTTLQLQLGDGDAAGSGIYARARGQLWIVPKETLAALDVSPAALYERRVLGRALPKLVAVELGGSFRATLKREQDEIWLRWSDRISHAMPADPTRAWRFFRWLAALKATRFLPRSRARLATAWRIRVRFSGGGSQRLRIGGPCPGFPLERVLELEDSRRRVCIAQPKVLPERLEGLFPTRLFMTRLAQLTQISLSFGGRQLRFFRRSGRWNVASTTEPRRASRRVERPRLASWLAKLQALRGRRAPAGTKARAPIDLPDRAARRMRNHRVGAGSGPASGKQTTSDTPCDFADQRGDGRDVGQLSRKEIGCLSLTLDSGRVIGLMLRTVAPGRVLARRAGATDGLLFDEQASALLGVDWIAFRERQIWSFDAHQVGRLAVTARSGKHVVFERELAGPFQRRSHGKIRPADPRQTAGLGRLVVLLSRLRARDYARQVPSAKGADWRLHLSRRQLSLEGSKKYTPAGDHRIELWRLARRQGCWGRLVEQGAHDALAARLDPELCHLISSLIASR